MTISSSTFARAFSVSTTNMRDAVGNYENSTSSKIAKGFIGILTLGIGYGVIRLIEEFANIKPKIDDYCANAQGIYDALSTAVAKAHDRVTVKLINGREITFTEKNNMEAGGERNVVIFDGMHTEVIKGTLQDICLKWEKEFDDAPGYYHISEDQKNLAEKIASENALKNSKDAIPSFEEFCITAENGAEAKAARVDAANTRWQDHYQEQVATKGESKAPITNNTIKVETVDKTLPENKLDVNGLTENGSVSSCASDISSIELLNGYDEVNMRLIKEKYELCGEELSGENGQFFIRQVYGAMRELYQPENIFGYTQENKETKPTLYYRYADLTGRCTLEHSIQKNVGFEIPYRGTDYQSENRVLNGVMRFHEIRPRLIDGHDLHISRSPLFKVGDIEKVDFHKKAMDAFEGKLTLKRYFVEKGVNYANTSLNLGGMPIN